MQVSMQSYFRFEIVRNADAMFLVSTAPSGVHSSRSATRLAWPQLSPQREAK